jgi:hypothetical protein
MQQQQPRGFWPGIIGLLIATTAPVLLLVYFQNATPRPWSAWRDVWGFNIFFYTVMVFGIRAAWRQWPRRAKKGAPPHELG